MSMRPDLWSYVWTKRIQNNFKAGWVTWGTDRSQYMALTFFSVSGKLKDDDLE